MSSRVAVAAPNVTAEQQAALDRVRRFARTMDAMVDLPWLNLRVGLDALVGLIPVLGDIADVMWKPNIRNVAMLERYLAER